MNFRPLVSICLLGTACAPATSGRAGATPVAATAAAPPADLDRDGIDPAVAPGDSFFGYANGGWLRSHDIPPDRASYGVGVMLVELTAKRTAALIADAAAQASPAGSDAHKIGDCYASFMDEAT